MKQTKIYPPEFKKEAVFLAEKIGVPQAAQDLGVSDSTLYAWKKKITGVPSIPNHSSSPLSLEEEVEKLRKENQLLRQERDILKKSVAIFVKEPSPGSRS